MEFPANPVHQVHGAIHALLLAAAPAVAGRVHPSQTPPLTISLLVDAASGRPVERRVEAGQALWVRLGLLEPEIVTELHRALSDAWLQGQPLTLAGAPFTIQRVAFAGPPSVARPLTTYADLATAAPVPEVVLRFTTPTLFRNKGRHLLEPEPRLVFGSYRRRWAPFSPVPLDGLDDATIRQHVQLVAQNVRVRPHDFGDARHPGFVGWAHYRVDGDIALQRTIAALAAYAPFCGTGARTTFGMGQTQWITRG